MIYLIGSLRNPRIPEVAAELRGAGFEVFDDWHAAGPHADDAWRDYERARGHDLIEAVEGYAAQHVFEFDYTNLCRADEVVLVSPAGKSAHLEFGWAIGKGKPGIILLDEDPERYDVMMLFADAVVLSTADLVTVAKDKGWL